MTIFVRALFSFIFAVSLPPWNGETKRMPGTRTNGLALTGEVAFCRSKPILARVSSSNTIALYRLGGGVWKKYDLIPAADPYDLTWSLDGSSLAWMNSDGPAVVWRKGKEYQIAGNNWSDSSKNVTSISLSPNGERFAIGRLGRAEEHIVGSGLLRSYRMGDSEKGVAVAYSPIGDLLAGGRNLLLAPVRQSRRVRELSFTRYISTLAANPNGDTIAALEFGSRLEIQMYTTVSKPKAVWQGAGYPNDLTWSPNGKLVAMVLGANEKAKEPETLNRVVILRSSDWRVIATFRLPYSTGGGLQFDYSSRLFSATLPNEQGGTQTLFWSTVTWQQTKVSLFGG